MSRKDKSDIKGSIRGKFKEKKKITRHMFG